MANAGLDDLLEDGEEFPAVAPHRRPWLLRAALPAFALTAVAYTLSHALGVAPPLVLLFAFVVGGFLIYEAAASGREPRWRRATDLVRPRLRSRVADDSGPADGVLTAVATWDRRLERARAAPRHAAALLVKQLGDLADERLRQRYGVSRGSDPARARSALGEGTWAVLHRAGHPPTDAEVDTVVQRLETL
jgi:hypothetical protein